MIESNLKPGIYLILCNTESDIELFSKKYKDPTFINLGTTYSIIPKIYVTKNKLKFEDTLLSSYSEAPKELMITLLDVIKKNSVIFTGTSGLSYESISEIIFHVKDIIKEQHIYFMICHKRKHQSDDVEIMEIDPKFTTQDLIHFLKEK